MKSSINYSWILSLLVLVLIVIPVSCSKDSAQENPGNPQSENNLQIKISGVHANVDTKTTLNGVVTSWIATTDKVGIFSPQARTTTAGGGSPVVNAEFTAASSAFKSNFAGTMYWGASNASHTLYAYYPYAAGSPAATAVPVSLPAAQTQSSANNTAHIGALDFLIATPVTVSSPNNTNPVANDVNLSYNHLFTVLEFQIKGTGQLKAVKLSANSTLAFSGGTINITQATPATGVSYTLASQTGTSNEMVVTLTTPATLTATNTDTKVYMVINPNTPIAYCLVGLSVDGTNWKYINKAAPVGGFKRGIKYVVTLDATTATDPLVDIQGNVYPTVTIGSQVWMGSNLKTTQYNDGTSIPHVSNATLWSEQSNGAYCNYNNSGTNGTTYGALYNWHAVNTGKLCPTGWRVPTSDDWTTLTNAAGGFNYASSKLKETGTTHWSSTNASVTNEFGFTALPGGRRNHSGVFEYINTTAFLWTSTANGAFANYKSMENYSQVFGGSYQNLKNGCSVRCVKN